MRPVSLLLVVLALLLPPAVAERATGHDAGYDAPPSFEVGNVGVTGGAVRLQLSNRTVAWSGPEVSPGEFPPVYPVLYHDITRRETRDTGFRGSMVCFEYPTILLWQYESWHGDLNRDGDTDDAALVAYDVTSAKSWTLAYGARGLWPWPCASAGRVGYARSEVYADVDYNHDGDRSDTVGFVFDLKNETETLLGPAYDGLLAGRYVVWLCPNDRPSDLCYQELLGTQRGRIPLSTSYPGGHPQFVGADRDHVVLTLWEGTEARDSHLDINGDGALDQAWLALLTLSTGEFRVDLGIGHVSPYSGSQVSEGQVYLYHGYGYPVPNGSSGAFVYDIATRSATELAYGYLVHPHFHPGAVLGNNHGGFCFCDPGEPRPLPPNVLLYDIRAGQTIDTGVDGYLEDLPLVFDGDTFVLTSTEESARRDVNGDGDLSDVVVIYVTIRRVDPADDPAVSDPSTDSPADPGTNSIIDPPVDPGTGSGPFVVVVSWSILAPLLFPAALGVAWAALRRRGSRGGRHR